MLANVKEGYAMQVSDPAVVPEKRIKPKRGLIGVVGMMLGLLGCIFTVFFHKVIENTRAAKAEKAHEVGQ